MSQPRAFPVPWSNLTNVAFTVPFYSSPTLQIPTNRQASDSVSFLTVKDISGLTASNPQSNIQLQTPNFSNSLAEQFGFFNYMTFSNQATLLQATNVSSFTANVIYTSTTQAEVAPQDISSNILEIRTYQSPSLSTSSTVVSNTIVSSLVFQDQETGIPSSLYISANQLYIGPQPVNPFVSLNPRIQSIQNSPWSPANIPNLQTWFDGKDSNTMFIDSAFTRSISTGESMALWLDKSANQFSCIQDTLSNQPLFLSNQIYFNSTSYMSTNFRSYSTCTILFSAQRKTNADASPGGGFQYFFAASNLIWATDPINNPLWTGLTFYSQANNKHMQSPFYSINVPGYPNYTGYELFFNNIYLPNLAYFPSTPNIYTILYDKPNSNIAIGRQNGVNFDRQLANPVILDHQYWNIGDVASGGGPRGFWGDILVYDRWLQEDEIQQLESYLAHKYDIVDRLQPGANYYKFSP